MVLSAFRGVRNPERVESEVRRVTMLAADRQWSEYAAICQEMEAFSAGYFYPAGSAKPTMWRGQESADSYARVMERHVAAAFPTLYRNAWGQVKAHAFGFPLVRRVTEALATSTAEIVEPRPISAEDGTEIVGYRVTAGGDSVATEWAQFTRLWPRLYETSGLPDAFRDAESRGELHTGCFLWPRIVGDEVITDALSPHRVKADPWELAPRRLDLALSVEVPLSGTAPWDSEEGALRVRYRRVVLRAPDEPEWQVEILDPDGDVVDDVRAFGEGFGVPADVAGVGLRGQNMLGAHPVIGWYSQPNTAIHPEPDWSLHRSQIGINLWLIQINEAFLLGSSGVWAIKGTSPDSFDANNNPVKPERPFSLRNVWSLGETETVERLDARVQMTELMDAVERRLKLEAIARNLPPSVFDTERIPANYSGASRLVERADLELARQRRERVVAGNMERVIDMWCRVRQMSPRPLPSPYDPSRVAWKVLLRNLPPDTWDQSAAQAAQAMASLGVEPPWRWTELLERLTPAEAIGRTKYYRSFVESPTAPGTGTTSSVESAEPRG